MCMYRRFLLLSLFYSILDGQIFRLTSISSVPLSVFMDYGGSSTAYECTNTFYMYVRAMYYYRYLNWFMVSIYNMIIYLPQIYFRLCYLRQPRHSTVHPSILKQKAHTHTHNALHFFHDKIRNTNQFSGTHHKTWCIVNGIKKNWKFFLCSQSIQRIRTEKVSAKKSPSFSSFRQQTDHICRMSISFGGSW